MYPIIAANDQNTFFILCGWIVFSCVAGAIARNRGNSFAVAFFISIGLSPLIGIIVALVQKPNEAAIEKERLQSGSSKKCPFCAELIKKEARVCRYCGRDINPQRGISPATEEQIEELWRESGIGCDTNPAPAKLTVAQTAWWETPLEKPVIIVIVLILAIIIIYLFWRAAHPDEEETPAVIEYKTLTLDLVRPIPLPIRLG
jgi:hypothetical protein